MASAFSRVLRSFFIGLATLHLSKTPSRCIFFFKNLESLLNVVVADKHLQMFSNRVAFAAILTLATGKGRFNARTVSATTV
jgi:hypothetical protein